MRPVERGAAPRIYNNYRNAIKDLVNRLGPYCSYCERRLPTGLSVEHVFPKSLYVDRALDWSNFLLACVNCNSTKGNNDPLDIFLPDRDNTLLVLSYFRGGVVPVAAQMDIQSTRRARGLIDFLGLDRHGATGWPRPASRDNRRRDREKAWNRNNRVRALKLAWNSECLLAGHRQNDRNGDDKLRDGTSSKVPPTYRRRGRKRSRLSPRHAPEQDPATSPSRPDCDGGPRPPPAKCRNASAGARHSGPACPSAPSAPAST